MVEAVHMFIQKEVKMNPHFNLENTLISADHNPAPHAAADRVKFILGVGDHEEEQTAQMNPQLFTELEELFVYLDGNVEWKETARW